RYALMKFGIHPTVSKSNRATTNIKGKLYNRKPIYELTIEKGEDIKIFAKNIKLYSENKQISDEVIEKIRSKRTVCSTELAEVTYGDKGLYFKDKGKIENLRRVSVKSVEYIGEKNV